MRKMIAAALAALALGAAVVRFSRAAGPQAPPAKQTPPATQTQAPLHQGGYLNSYIALLRSELKPRKVGFISEGLHLNEKDSALFWPIYKSYEAEVESLDAARFQLVKDYSDNSDRMTSAKANELIERRFALEGRRVGLERAYFKRFEKVLPGKTVARFFQLEYRFSLMSDLKTVSEVPLIE